MKRDAVSTGRIPEWPNGADCKSAGLYLRWFESIFAHIIPTQPNQPPSGIALPHKRCRSPFIILIIILIIILYDTFL